MTLPLVLLLALLAPVPDPAERALARADALAELARASRSDTNKEKSKIQAALAAYAAVLEAHAKDRRLVPKVRRRRAALLKQAGRIPEALAEYDAILAGRARRRDRAGALFDGAVLLHRAGDPEAAERRLARAIRKYPDITSTRAKASLARGRILEKLGRRREAAAAFRHVVKRCRGEDGPTIEAYDALALLAIEEANPRQARQWLRACMARYGKRAARADKRGAFLGRRLGAMKAPARLAEKGG